MRKLFVTFVLPLLLIGTNVAQEKTVPVDFQNKMQYLPHFWKSTGFTPSNLLLEDPMRQNIQIMGALPHQGMKYIRIHYLLELIKKHAIHKYDWSDFDRGMDLLVENDLIPFFEIMGATWCYFGDDKKKLEEFSQMVTDLANHCIERYGIEEVRKWYFETWNEPEEYIGKGFLNYYDACSKGLMAADPHLRFGGPGNYKTLHDVFTKLLAHNDTGKNVFTNQTGTRMDYISVHEKAIKSKRNWEDYPVSFHVVEQTNLIADYIKDNHPEFAHKPIINNECDIKAGWFLEADWRASSYYSAVVSKMIHQHIHHILCQQKYDFELMSFDNAFLGNWYQRTLLAMHKENDNFTMIQKPAYNVYVLLSLLGNQLLYSSPIKDTISHDGCFVTSRDSNQIAVLLYNAHDNHYKTIDDKITYTLDIKNIPFEQGISVLYKIDDFHSNPYQIWKDVYGKDSLLTRKELNVLRNHQHVQLTSEPKTFQEISELQNTKITLPNNGMALFLISKKEEVVPEKIVNVDIQRYVNHLNESENLIRWNGIENYNLMTYEVFYSKNNASFQKISRAVFPTSYFIDSNSNNHSSGFYKIVAKDFWGRTIAESEILQIK